VAELVDAIKITKAVYFLGVNMQSHSVVQIIRVTSTCLIFTGSNPVRTTKN